MLAVMMLFRYAAATLALIFATLRAVRYAAYVIRLRCLLMFTRYADVYDMIIFHYVVTLIFAMFRHTFYFAIFRCHTPLLLLLPPFAAVASFTPRRHAAADADAIFMPPCCRFGLLLDSCHDTTLPLMPYGIAAA